MAFATQPIGTDVKRLPSCGNRKPNPHKLDFVNIGPISYIFHGKVYVSFGFYIFRYLEVDSGYQVVG